MGTSIIQSTAQFTMTRANVEAAWESVADKDSHNGPTLQDRVAEMFWDRYDIDLTWDEEGNVTGMTLDCEKELSDGESFLQEIGPFVDAGSYIQVVNEHGELYRHVFDGETCEIVGADLEDAFRKDYKPHYERAVKIVHDEAESLKRMQVRLAERAGLPREKLSLYEDADYFRVVSSMYKDQLTCVNDMLKSLNRWAPKE